VNIGTGVIRCRLRRDSQLKDAALTIASQWAAASILFLSSQLLS